MSVAERADSVVERALAKFPGPLTVDSLTLESAAKNAFIVAVFVVAIEAYLAYTAPGVLPFTMPLLLFVSGSAVLIGLFLGWGRVDLDGTGFEVVSPLNTWSTTWDNVDRFEVVLTNAGRGARVRIVFCKCHQPPWNRIFGELAVDRRFLTRAVDGEEMSSDELGELMTRWGELALKRGAQRPPFPQAAEAADGI
jgi:hypothetical protein